MKKPSKLTLRKEVIVELQKNEMNNLLGRDKNLSWSEIASIRTEFTRVKSCCGGECVECNEDVERGEDQ